jgi:hypothetical protein
MKECPNCHKKIDDKAKQCPYCAIRFVSTSGYTAEGLRSYIDNLLVRIQSMDKAVSKMNKYGILVGVVILILVVMGIWTRNKIDLIVGGVLCVAIFVSWLIFREKRVAKHNKLVDEYEYLNKELDERGKK